MRQVNEAAAAATAAAAAEAPAPTAASMPAPAPAPAAVGAAGDLAAGEANEQLRAENEALRRQMEAENEALRQQMEARQPNSYSQSYWRIRFVFFFEALAELVSRVVPLKRRMLRAPRPCVRMQQQR